MYPNRPVVERRWALMVLCLFAATASAHDADVIYVTLTEAPPGALEERVTLTASTLSQLAPIDADQDGALSQEDLDSRSAAIAAGVWDQMPLQAATPCVRSSERALVRDGYVELVARFACPTGELSQDFRILRGLTSNYRVVLGRQVDGEAGHAFAQGNVQRLTLRPVPIAFAERELPGFGAGALSALLWFDVTLVWLLSMTFGFSLRAAAQRWLALVLGHAAASFALALFDVRVPATAAAALVTGVGAAFVLQILGSGKETWPLAVLGLMSLVETLYQGAGSTVGFQVGRGVGLLALAAVAVPIVRMVARRKSFNRKAKVALACASLAALGFSLVQTLRTF